ncbi:MAG: ribulose-phosphate 3-epimerase [Bacteroidota bacterium]
MKLLAASILSADFLHLRQEISILVRGGADWIHIDVMDGQFVPNITFGPFMVAAVRKAIPTQSTCPLDVHLMIIEPERYLREFRNAGADIITVHWETSPHLHRTVQQIKELGAKAGVAINPSTPVRVLEDIVQDVDLVLVMSVNPGFGGQKFIPRSMHKIKELVALRNREGSSPLIEVDGGITSENITAVANAGADVLVTGYSIFGHGDLEKNVRELKRKLLES